MVLTKIAKGKGVLFNLVVITPDDYNEQKKYPLVVFLHGIGSKADNMDLLVSGIPANLKKWGDIGFVVVAVQTADTFNDEVVFARQYALDNYSISNKYLTGLSYGAGGVWNFAGTSLEQAKMFDAIAPIATTWTEGKWENIANANLPVWAFHNNRDENKGTPSDASEAMVDAVNKVKPGLASLTQFNSTAHGGWDEAYDSTKPPVALNGEGLTNPTKTLAQWFLMNDANSRVPVPAATPQTGLQPVLEYALNGNVVSLDGTKSYGMRSAKLATIAAPAGVNIYGANIDGGGTATGRIALSTAGKYKFRLYVYPQTGYQGAPATKDIEVEFNVSLPQPTPIEFKPTHTIKRKDGSSEDVRIETL